jgi:hypothetical protein
MRWCAGKVVAAMTIEEALEIHSQVQLYGAGRGINAAYSIVVKLGLPIPVRVWFTTPSK